MFDQEKATQELKAELDKIVFAGEEAAAPTGTTTVEPSTPAPKEEPPKEPAVEPKPTLEPKPKAEEPTGDAPATPEPKEPEPPQKPAEGEEDKTSPAIPDSHYRAALHMGWKPEEVGELYDQNPDLALKTLAKCYEQVNAASKQLGELGQRARQLREQPPAAQPQVSRKEAVMKRLKEKYEDDPIIELIGELIPDQVPVPEVRGFRPQTPEPAFDQQTEIERQVAVRQQINTFFGADEMDIYGDFYGKVGQTGDWRGLTPGQRANRIEVCNRAQAILDGAAFSGMQLSAAQAMERAHLEVAAPLAEQFVRERIVKSVQKRAAGVTLKPSGSKTPVPAAGVYDKEQAVQEMKEEFNKVSW